MLLQWEDGVFLTALSDSDNNVIKIGNTDIEVQVLNAKHGIEAYGLTSLVRVTIIKSLWATAV